MIFSKGGDLSNSLEDSSEEISYVPIKLLGSGSFGEAFLYRKVEDNSLVVWKKIDLKKVDDRVRRETENEIKILSILSHPNVINYYNNFTDGEAMYIEMEYANGGTLHGRISRETTLFGESLILEFFYQIVSAVAYMHSLNILHRDIKSLNIFLMRNDVVKLGDFGISKLLDSTNQMLETCVGTPYYMSPEIIKGEKYDEKSDIWALGCVLYELLTRIRIFQATNPLQLATNIVTMDIPSIDAGYSTDVKLLLHQLLDKDMSKRPRASEIMALPVFDDTRRLVSNRLIDLDSSLSSSSSSSFSKHKSDSGSIIIPVVTSKSCELFIWGGGKVTPQKVEFFTKEKCPLQVAVGASHFAVVTMEKELYTWSNASGASKVKGQLGQGDVAAYKAPRRVQLNASETVNHVACGDEFTVCLTETGHLYFFGSNEYGCSGLDGEPSDSSHASKAAISGSSSMLLVPTLVTSLLDRPIRQLSCGARHVIALAEDGDVYTWGSGEFGCLGQGDEDDRHTPHKVELVKDKQIPILRVHAGLDRTIIITRGGRVFACGSNEYNKLGLNHFVDGVVRKPFVTSSSSSSSSPSSSSSSPPSTQCNVAYAMMFTLVSSLSRYNLVDAVSGLQHSILLDCRGRLVSMGNNKYGQLGVGDAKSRAGVNLVGGALVGKKVVRVGCGDYFTVASTDDNMLFSWGLGEHGRLGNSSLPSSSHPKPVFGSLHTVSHVSCSAWNAAIIAEKVLNQKAIKPVGKYQSSKNPSSEYSTTNDSNDDGSSGTNYSGGSREVTNSSSNKSTDDDINYDDAVFSAANENRNYGDDGNTTGGNTTDYVPDWLKAEVEYADELERLKKKETAGEDGCDVNDTDDASKKLKSFVDEINELKELNAQFKAQLMAKDRVISEQQKLIETLETEVALFQNKFI